MSDIAIKVKNLDISYKDHNTNKDKQVLFNVNLEIFKNQVTALIGASGCGKSTFLRSINRMNDTVEGCKMTGEIIINNQNILDKNIDVVLLRSKVGMVFQKPNPFPKSIYENVAYGLKIHNICNNKTEIDDRVEDSLIKAGLFDEVKNRLNSLGNSLSGGQQQRLCIARAIAIQTDIILMDEPCSALDPIATAKIEELLSELKEKYTIVIVTHSMQQAARISDNTAFFNMGEIIEFGNTNDIFNKPKLQQTQDYITGRFG